MQEFDYKAFIAYRHTDEKEAAWLQRELESYRVPSRLIGTSTKSGPITRRIGAIFRDREELPAGGGLTEKLSEALVRSEYLIVVCSPAARHSRWVNLEIEEFKKTHPDSRILCFIVDGQPFASNDPSSSYLECFPKALKFLDCDAEGENLAAEPLAADCRKEGDGRRLAKLKIVSGLLGVGLDQLIRRDAQRRHRKLLAVSFTSAIGMLAFAFVSFLALDAQNSEELRRAEAEDLIEFMLTDLRNRLEEVGRLDVLDAVGEKALEYYSNSELSEYSESSLGRRARAFHLLGEVDELEGDIENARASFNEAYRSTAELLARNPNDEQRIYDHAQSEYWLGYLDYRLGEIEKAGVSFQAYISLARQLTSLDPKNLIWLTELAYANVNYGVYIFDTVSPLEAESFFRSALLSFQEVDRSQGSDSDSKYQIGQARAFLADVYEQEGLYTEAKKERQQEIDIYQTILLDDSRNQIVHLSMITARHALGSLSMYLGDFVVALENLEEAAKEGKMLAAGDPENTQVKQFLASALLALGNAQLDNGNYAASVTTMVEADRILTSLILIDNELLNWQVLQLRLQLARGKHDEYRGMLEEALVKFQQTAGDAAAKILNYSDANELDLVLAETNFNIANVYFQLDKADEARASARQAIDNLESPRISLNPRSKAILALSYSIVGERLRARKIAKEVTETEFNHPDFQSLESLAANE